MNTNTRFIAVVGTALVIMIGILAYQKFVRCNAAGGTDCCFGRCTWIGSKAKPGL